MTTVVPDRITAEQAVLGAMLLSKAAITDVIDTLRPSDFSLRTHRTVFARIMDLYNRREPADPVTVTADLDRRGELLRVGGAQYLHTLISIVPAATDAKRYAEIVASAKRGVSE